MQIATYGLNLNKYTELKVIELLIPYVKITTFLDLEQSNDVLGKLLSANNFNNIPITRYTETIK